MKLTSANTAKSAMRVGLIVGLISVGALPFFPQEKKVKNETIEATAMGTGTQLGSEINVSLEIYQYSTPEDRRQVLIQAFEKGQNQGLVNALSRMKAVGHC